jgi:hypothetical protein
MELIQYSKRQVYSMFRLYYNETASIWLSWGFCPNLNVKGNREEYQLQILAKLPSEIVNHIVDFIPRENFEKIVRKIEMIKNILESGRHTYLSYQLFNTWLVEPRYISRRVSFIHSQPTEIYIAEGTCPLNYSN